MILSQQETNEILKNWCTFPVIWNVLYYRVVENMKKSDISALTTK